MSLYEQVVSNITNYVKNDSRIISVYLLGSYAKGTFTSKSDIDKDLDNLKKANLLGMYHRFNDDRKEILNAYRT